VHTILNHAGNIPDFVVITKAKKSDVTIVGAGAPSGQHRAYGPGYIDYRFYCHLRCATMSFVARPKVNARL
jgi:hypothetical protein